MKVKVCEIIVAEGNEMQCAIYTYMLLDMLKQMVEKEQKTDAKKQADIIDELLRRMPFDELIKREREDQG